MYDQRNIVNEISQLNTDVWLPDLPNSDTDEKGVGGTQTRTIPE